MFVLKKTIYLFVMVVAVLLLQTTSDSKAESCSLQKQKAYKSSDSTSVYYVTENCTKRVFRSGDVYFTYFTSWNDASVVSKSQLSNITNDQLGFMPWGPLYDPKYGALVKTITDPNVYLLLGNEKYWITDENVFNSLNYSWSWIEDIDQRLLDNYLTGSEISYTNHHPNYTLIKYPNDSKVYRLVPDTNDAGKQVKKHITNETEFNSLGYRWDRIVEISQNEIYPDFDAAPISTNTQTPPTPTPAPKKYALVQETNAGKTTAVTMNVGDVYPLPNHQAYLRFEEVNNGTIKLTLWSKKTNSCRLVDYIFLKNINNHERYAFFLNWFLELQSINGNAITLKLHDDNLAYTTCRASTIQQARCNTFRPLDSYTIQSGYFSRHFRSAAEYDFNELMLDYNIASFNKLKDVFPSLREAKPLGNTWEFSLVDMQSGAADSAWMDATTLHVGEPQGEMKKLITDKAKRDFYQTKLANNDLKFLFSTDMHEWAHLFLFDTELLRFPSPAGKSSLLSEGIADYLQSIVKYYPNETDLKHQQCGEAGFSTSGSVLDGMSYVDAFAQGYTYDAGNCFFKKVENACGLATIDKMFENLLAHQYAPFTTYPSMFKTLKDNCQNPAQFDIIMTNFGFPQTLSSQSYPLLNSNPIQELGCPL